MAKSNVLAYQKKKWEGSNSVVVSVCLSVSAEQLASNCMDFHCIWYWRILLKSVDQIQVRRKSVKNNSHLTWRPVGRDSVVHIATSYGLDGQGIESMWGRDFPQPSRPAGLKRPGDGVDHPSPSSAEDKERVELYLPPPPGLRGLFLGELYCYFKPYTHLCYFAVYDRSKRNAIHDLHVRNMTTHGCDMHAG